MEIVGRLKKEGLNVLNKEILGYVGYPQSEAANLMCSLRGADGFISMDKIMPLVKVKGCDSCNHICIHVYFRDMMFSLFNYGYLLLLLNPISYRENNLLY